MIKLLMSTIMVSAAGLALAGERPNVVVILADDLGYADVGYHGSKDVLTPNIDSIAENGVSFTQGYVTGFVCGPTRAGLMTGRYQERFGSEGNPGPYVRKGEVCGVPLDVKMMSERFKALGYRTACFGKWHLGGERGNTDLFPLNRGFDEFFGFLEGAARYEDVENVERKYMRGNVLVEREDEYYTDALGRETVLFIERGGNEPFFLYLPFNAVHSPMQAKKESLEKFAHIPDEGRRKLCAMLWSMDENIGRVLNALKETDEMDNTLIFFLSDNGGKPANNFSLNHPYRGQKGEFYDGGIHVPFCIQWNGHIAPGSVYKNPVSSLDIFPTSLAAAGQRVNVDVLDGSDLLPFLSGKKKGTPHDALYWKSGNKSAVRVGDWKLVQTGGKSELFNLAVDPYEETNISKTNPEKLQELQKAYKRWDEDNIPENYGWNKAIGPKVEPPENWKKKLK
jgi:arylsulfatase A-like enzyme